MEKVVPPLSLIPVRLPIWLVAMRSAAPEVNPTTTEWETKFTRAPSRAKPNPIWKSPTRNVSVRTICIYSGLDGVANLPPS